MLKRYSFYVLVGLFLLLIFRSENNLTELKSSHFQGRLSIYRDAMGVPHIVADNRNALVYGIGYAQAQDRLWTFHFKKRLLEGRVSELFGKDTLPLDRYMRNLNIRNVGVETGQHMDNLTRSYAQSYINGVNDYARSLKLLPLEFYLFWTSWEDFTTNHIGAMLALFSITLEFDWMYEIARERLKETVGMDLAMKLIPCSTENQFKEITIVKDDELKELGLFKEYNQSDYKRIVAEHWGKLNLSLPAFGSPKLPFTVSGSNAWVVGKQHSATGRPILSNDPHVGLTIPSIFYPMEVILINEKDQVVAQAFGAGFDGIPGISIGKNKHFAWASTSLYADSKDVYAEDVLVHANGTRSYLCDGQYLPLQERKEVIHVRGSSAYEETYYQTHRGPILSQLFMDIHLKYGFPMPTHHENMLSLQISPYTQDSGKSMRAIIDCIFSETLQQFQESGEMMQYVNIDSSFISTDPDLWGFAVIGRIPKKNIPEMGSFVKNGTTTFYDQKESLKPQERPSLINPKRGYVAMTNNKFASDNYAHRASLHEVSNGRSYRLEELLTTAMQQGKKFTLEDMMQMQQDTKDSYVDLVMKDLLKIFRDNRKDWIDSEFGDKITKWLEEWNCEFNRNKFEPSIYAIWEHEFQRLLLANIGLSEQEHTAITSHAFFELYFFKLVKKLAANNDTTTEDRLLCLNEHNKGSPNNPCIVNMLIAFNKLEASLYEWFGTLDNTQWKWGTIHKKLFTFVPWTEIPGISSIFSRRVPAHGNSRTLNVGIHSYQKKSFDCFGTATFRFVTDMNRTYYSADLGVSDRVTSPYYDNFLHEFNDGKYFQHIEYHPFHDQHNWTLTASSFAKRVDQKQEKIDTEL